MVDFRLKASNIAIVQEWWGQTDEKPEDVAKKYNLKLELVATKFDERLYKFSGPIRNIEDAISDGYFYSIYCED